MLSSNKLFGNEFVGLSTDTKPTDSSVPNGATFLEIDTSIVYIYDKENEQWREL